MLVSDQPVILTDRKHVTWGAERVPVSTDPTFSFKFLLYHLPALRSRAHHVNLYRLLLPETPEAKGVSPL